MVIGLITIKGFMASRIIIYGAQRNGIFVPSNFLGHFDPFKFKQTKNVLFLV